MAKTIKELLIKGTFCTFLIISSLILSQLDYKLSSQYPVYKDSQMKQQHRTFKNQTVRKGNITYNIQIITPIWSQFPWRLFTEKYFGKCTCRCSCKLIYDRKLLRDSNVVIFHGMELPKLNNLYQKKPPSQRWRYFVQESPVNSPKVNTIKKYFDFSITMSRKSNFQFRYFETTKLTQELPANKSINYAHGKTKMVAWYVSNCAKKHRMDFVKRLERSGVNVHVGGKCNKDMKNKLTTCSNKNRGYRSCEPILKDFKFYFAAENSFCNDYITEKYYLQGMLGNTIPIVLGAGNYSDPRNAAPKSFINPLDFKDFDEFVAHIKMLDKNDTAYNEYFKWKQTWTTGPKQHKGCDPLICDICTNLHEGGANLVGGNLVEQYSLDECKTPFKRYVDWFRE